MWTLRGMALVLAVFVTACTESPTWPQSQALAQNQTQTPPPPTNPVAKLELMFDGSAPPDCRSNRDCRFHESIQNTGSGCASGTTAVLRFNDGVRGPQVGPDYPMDAVGGGLAAKIIRPNEIVALVSLDYVDSGLSNRPNTYYWIYLAWNDVACP